MSRKLSNKISWCLKWINKKIYIKFITSVVHTWKKFSNITIFVCRRYVKPQFTPINQQLTLYKTPWTISSTPITSTCLIQVTLRDQSTDYVRSYVLLNPKICLLRYVLIHSTQYTAKKKLKLKVVYNCCISIV